MRLKFAPLHSRAGFDSDGVMLLTFPFNFFRQINSRHSVRVGMPRDIHHLAEIKQMWLWSSEQTLLNQPPKQSFRFVFKVVG